MTIGEIKKEALKLMFTNQDNEIDDNTVDELSEDANYGEFLNNMYGSINRAIVRLKSKGVEYKGEWLKPNTNDDTELALDPELCMLIPYFIKGDLYEEDNAQLSVMSRNMFEDMVDDYLSTKINTAIETVFEMDV